MLLLFLFIACLKRPRRFQSNMSQNPISHTRRCVILVNIRTDKLTVDFNFEVEERPFSLLIERLVDLFHVGGGRGGSCLFVTYVGKVARLVVWNGHWLGGLGKGLVGSLEQTCFKYGNCRIGFISRYIFAWSSVFLNGTDHSEGISNFLFSHRRGRGLSNFLEPVIHLFQALLSPPDVSVQIVNEFIALQVLAYHTMLLSLFYLVIL